MIRFNAIIKETMKEFEPEAIEKNDGGVWWEGNNYSLSEIILRMGVEIGGEWHFENDVYKDKGSFYILHGYIGGWILNGINRSMPRKIGFINEFEKIGHLWNDNEIIQELVKRYDPEVYSCFQRLGRFSEVMK